RLAWRALQPGAPTPGDSRLILFALRDPGLCDRRRTVCHRHQPAQRPESGTPRNPAATRTGQEYRERNGAISGTQTGFLDSLVSAVRENPLSAALIGGGALWLLVGNEKLKNAAT